MKKTSLIDARFQDLLVRGDQVLATRRPPAQNVIGDDRVDLQGSQEWTTSASQFLESIFGRESEYYERLQKSWKYAGYYSDMVRALGVFKAAWNDYSKGYLTDLKTLVRAEVFDDILEQAEQLFEQGYHQPAAVLAGCVLEDTLRKMCDLKSISLPPKPKLDTMNAELAKNGVYNTLVQKRVTMLADVRNKAAHGQLSEFSVSDVNDMLRQVREFVTNYLT
jgi:hypothetical protein